MLNWWEPACQVSCISHDTGISGNIILPFYIAGKHLFCVCHEINFKISTLCLNKPCWLSHYIFFDSWWANRSWCCNIGESYMLLTVWRSISRWKILLLHVMYKITCSPATIFTWPVINQHCSCVHLLTSDILLPHVNWSVLAPSLKVLAYGVG